MAAVFGATSPGLVSLEFSGTYYGPESRAATLLAPLMAKMPKGATLTTKSLDWIEGLEAFAGGDGTLNTATPDTVRSLHRLFLLGMTDKLFCLAR